MDIYRELLLKIDKNCKKISEYQPTFGYNIFEMLGIHAKEVLMCRVLADLLNPEGRHGYGTFFLQSFLAEVMQRKNMSDVLLEHTCVEREYVIENDRRIDIMIYNSEFSIPLEAKIYAGEQEAQCYDYYAYAKKSPIVYLTRFGNEPSLVSRTKKGGADILDLERIRCISWKYDICEWLSGLVGTLAEPVKSVIMQYIDAIHIITDDGDRIRMTKTLEILYESPEYFGAALEIEKVAKKAKLQLIRLLFDDFKEAMKELEGKYGLEPETEAHYYSYESGQHDRFFDSTYTTFPGLNYVVKKAQFANQNLQMWFRIEIDYNLFAGFAMFDTAATGQNDDRNGYQVDEITEALLEESAQYLDKDIMSPVDWWLTWCYPNGKCQEGNYDDVPNFKEMNQCAIDLIDDDKRRCFVTQAIGMFEERLLRFLR